MNTGTDYEGMTLRDAEIASQKVTVNLEDAVLEEQKLYQILEVSYSC